MSVDITLSARDRISQQIDAITKSVNSLNSAFEELENQSAKAGNKASVSLEKIASASSAVGKGLTNFSSEECRKLMGRQSSENHVILNYDADDEVIHRNNLVVK